MSKVRRNSFVYWAVNFITACLLVVLGAQGAYAQPALTIAVDQIDPAGNNTPINNCQNVTFRVTLTNTGTTDAVNVDISNSMPIPIPPKLPGFEPISASSNDNTVTAGGGSITRDFTYTATCSAASGDNSTSISFEDPLGTNYTINTPPRPFTVNPGAITITKVATHVNGGAITETSEPKAAINDVVTWKITVKSSGLGSVKNVEVTETLGSGLEFSPVVASPRLFDKNTHASLADIPTNGTVDIFVDTKVKSCSNLTNDVSGIWGCGAGACLAAVTAQSSVDLQIKSPLLDYAPPDVNFTPGYCESSALVTGITIPITNTGDGIAENVQLKVDFGTSITVDAVTAPAGASYNTGTKTFQNIGNIAAGATTNLVYNLRYTPPANWCSGSATGGGTLFWEPIYFDICGIQYYPPLKTSSYLISLDPAKPQPTIAISKSCTVDGSAMDMITQLKDTAQAVECTITVDYSFPATCPAPSDFSVTDTYPAEWTAGSISPFPTNYNNSGNPITWTIPAASLTGTGSITYTQNFTIPALGAAVCPACGTLWTNTVSIAGIDCCTCNMSDNDTVTTTVDCPAPELGISSTRAIAGSGAEVCNGLITFTSTYTFTGSGWNSVPWANNIRFTEDMANALELVGVPILSTNLGCLPAFTHGTGTGKLVIDITGQGTCGNSNILENTVLTISYTLRPTTNSQPQCGVSNSFIDFATFEVFNTGGVGFGTYCPAGGGIVVRDANQIDVSGSEMTVDIVWDTSTPIVGPCGEYDATITVTKTSDNPAFDAVLYLENVNYDVLSVTGTTGLVPANGASGTAVTNGYAWNYEDLFSGVGGQIATIKVHVQGKCLSDPTLKVYLGYNDRCDDGDTGNNYADRTWQANDPVTGIISNPILTVEKFP